MTLINSISGIRGTIGGKAGESLSPIDVVKFAAGYGTFLKTRNPEAKKIVIGRDARLSGEIINSLVCKTLQAMGFDIVDLGLSTTPTVEMAVPMEKADGGIILTASHNPINWNALKLLNEKGEFISAEDGKLLNTICENNSAEFADVKKLGSYKEDSSYLQKHIDAILALDLVDQKAIAESNFNIIVDPVNSSGTLAVPALLKALGVTKITLVNGDTTGNFAHNPEPLPENLLSLTSEMKKGKYNLGIVVDPDVDRLAFMCEDGEPFGEEYTLVAVADYILQKNGSQGLNTVSNLSSTGALKDVTEKHHGNYYASAVGEVNVVTKMKEVNAIIGGEGNGGIILPELHYGRDALVGIALFLSHLAQYKKSVGFLRKSYPNYYIAKKKYDLPDVKVLETVMEKIKSKYSKNEIDTQDGVKILFDKEWVHLRPSNTEPIIRIYAESEFETTANNLAEKLISDLKELL